MKTPDDRKLLTAWEQGWGGTSTERALSLLSVCYPEKDLQQLAGLTVGRRDGLLLSLRKRIFGSNLEMVVDCPSCGEQLEFSMPVEDLQVTSLNTEQPQLDPVEWIVDYEGWVLEGHVPTAHDLLTIEGNDSFDQPLKQLLDCCFHTVKRQDEPQTVDDLPVPILNHVDEELRERDPQAEILFDLDCPSCEQSWESVFDIAEYLWREVDVEARRLMRQIDRLARTYGWNENEILDLAPFRRNCYLDLLENAS